MSGGNDHAYEDWVERARAVDIQWVVSRRQLNLKRIAKNELAGPCPRCGGDDRFSINTNKHTWLCRQCHAEQDLGGDTIGVLRLIDRIEFERAVEILTGQERPNGKANGDIKHAQQNTPRRIVAQYDYHDSTGHLRYRVVRFEPKEFRQWQPDGNGGWIQNVKGVEPLPYKLPEILEAIAQEQIIYIVEGEKDVDNLYRAGVWATTSSGGEGSARKVWPTLRDHFRDAIVCIIPDNDEAGRKYADVVGSQLAAICRRITVLQLPASGDKADVSDWLASGGTVERLQELTEQAKPWCEGFFDKPKIVKLEILDWTRWQDRPIPRRRWLVRDRIPRTNVALLSGDGSAGKTTIAAQLAVATRRGSDWLGAIIEDGGDVIYMTAEEDDDEMHRRFGAITESFGIAYRDFPGIGVLCMPGEDCVLGAPDKSGAIVQPTELFLRLEMAVCDIKPALLIIESSADVYAGDENNRSQSRQFIGLLRRISIRSTSSVLLLAHPSLSGMSSGTGMSGSTGWNNSVRSRLYLTGVKADKDGAEDVDIRELKVMKSNYGPAGEIVRVRWDNGIFRLDGPQTAHQQAAGDIAIEMAFLHCLDVCAAQGRSVSDTNSKTFAPAVFEDMPEARGYKNKPLRLAMARLFSARKIKVLEIGPTSKRRAILVRDVGNDEGQI